MARLSKTKLSAEAVVSWACPQWPVYVALCLYVSVCIHNKGFSAAFSKPEVAILPFFWAIWVTMQHVVEPHPGCTGAEHRWRRLVVRLLFHKLTCRGFFVQKSIADSVWFQKIIDEETSEESQSEIGDEATIALEDDR